MSTNEQPQPAVAVGLPPSWFFGAGDRAVPGRPDMHASPLTAAQRDVAARRHHLANTLQAAAFNVHHAVRDLVADDRVGALGAALDRLEAHRVALLKHESALRAEVAAAADEVTARQAQADVIADYRFRPMGEGVAGDAVSEAS